MTPADLEAVIARTGHERFRALTSDANPDAGQREAYRALVAHLASADPPTPPAERPKATMAELRDATKLGSSRCWLSYKDDTCGCAGFKCHLLGRQINIYDCVGCLKRW